ncbi:hypothetical protein ASPZODRAFT_68973 [Penicilliopsis zonata CBS 506.65]|uniref:VWFA domain-containing protein n=1 Tax=Penicilliopsis zonata CBS 506.65 TaxID=1073090 RepID=A0A1L9SER5_9EURO|nr:hypothetical protein ASPZODRAFT_68973 [Penicilliopsis zonata CBS 506.65]OJJ45671.1 hypothetical protein ASPZODRAFT_68973 [Penicilliopsis zonata CBS 506.65]
MGHRHSTARNGEFAQSLPGSMRPVRSNAGYSPRQDIKPQAPQNLWSPPPYTPQDAVRPSPNGISNSNSVGDDRGGGDSPYAFLAEFDTVFLVDDSSSMLGQRWKEAEAAIATIAPICTQYDSDGIDIFFLNHRRAITATNPTGAYMNVTTSADVQEIFYSVQPRGATPVGNRLLQILKPYLRRVEAMTAASDADGNLSDPSLFVKPLNIIVITDGVFTDDAESVIVDTARRLDGPLCRAVPWQVGIQFFQIGDDNAAREHLQELDDELGQKTRNGGLRDIVDTVPWRGERGQTLSAEGILKCVLGAVHKKYDKREAFR